MATAEVLPIAITAEDRTKSAWESLRASVLGTQKELQTLRSAFEVMGGSGVSSLDKLRNAANLLRTPWVATVTGIAAAGAGAYLAHRELSGLGDAAGELGLKASEIDKLEIALKKTGGSAATAVPALRSLMLNAQEALRADNDLGKLFEANSIKLTESNKNLRSTSDLYGLVAGMIRNAKNESDRLFIATSAFGSESGPAMVKAIMAGADQLDRLKGGRDALDPLVDKALEFDRVWKEIAKSGDGFVESLKRGAMPIMDALYQSTLRWAALFGSKSAAQSLFIEGQRGSQMPASRLWNPDDQHAIDSFYNAVGFKSTKTDTRDDKDAKNAFDRQVNSIARHIALMEADASAVDKTAGEHERLRVQAQLLEAAQRAGIEVTGENAKKFAELEERARKAGDALAFAKLQSDIGFERAQLGRTEIEQRVASQLRSARIDPNSAQGEMLAQQIRLNEELKQTKDISADALKGFISDLRAGKTATEAFANALNRLGTKAIDKSIDSIFASLFKTSGSGSFNLFNLFGSGNATSSGTGLSLTTTGGLYHSGGMVGTPTSQSIMVPNAIIPSLPRFHNGLAPDERLAVLQVGEEVRSRAQVARDRRRATGGIYAPITIVAPDPPSFNKSRGQVGRAVAQAWQRAQRYS